MAEMRVVFACFRRFNLRINMKKTKAILKVVGTLKHRIKKEYICKQDDHRRLLLSARNPDSWLTLVPCTEYLGLIISYDSFEQQSLRHRLQKGTWPSLGTGIGATLKSPTAFRTNSTFGEAVYTLPLGVVWCTAG